MSTKIDWSKPIKCSDGRGAFVISTDARLPDSDERLVAIAIKQHGQISFSTDSIIYRTYSCNEHRPANRNTGSALKFINPEEKHSVYLRYNVQCGDTSSHRAEPLGSAVISVKLDFVNGIATEAKLVTTNVDKAPSPPLAKRY